MLTSDSSILFSESVITSGERKKKKEIIVANVLYEYFHFVIIYRFQAIAFPPPLPIFWTVGNNFVFIAKIIIPKYRFRLVIMISDRGGLKLISRGVY